MSARLLQGRDKTHTPLDDRESAYWVLLYVALHYLRHNLQPHELFQKLQTLFDYSTQVNGRMLGGNAKAQHLKHGDRFEEIQFDIPQLVDMFDELADSLRKPYLKIPSDELKAKYEALVKSEGEEGALMWDTAPGRYFTAEKNLEDEEWLVKTLRKHADLIPLPSQEAKTKYDYHYNLVTPNPSCGEGDILARHHQSHITTSRVDGLAGQLTSSKLDADDKPEDGVEKKRRKKATPKIPH